MTEPRSWRPKPRRGPRGRRLLVEGVDLGDGERARVWLELLPDVEEELDNRRPGRVVVRLWHSSRRWELSLAEAARVVAVAAQRKAIGQRLGGGQ